MLEANFSIEQIEADKPYFFEDAHVHHYFEILFISNGCVEFIISDNSCLVQKNNAVLVDIGVLHKVNPDGESKELEGVLLSFNPQFLDIFEQQHLNMYINRLFSAKHKMNPLVSFDSKQEAQVKELFARMMLENSNLDDKNLVKVYLMQLFILLDRLRKPNDAAKQKKPSNDSQQRIKEIEDYINENYTMSLSLDKLAAQFYLNKYYLCHIFKTITGSSVIEYINRKRLTEAEILLKYSKLSITKIAYNVGFNSDIHFIRMFKQANKITPKEYRAICLENSRTASIFN